MADAFDQVRALLKEAVRASFSSLREQFPKQTFYAFALSDSDGTGPSPFANSEERWRAQVTEKRVATGSQRFLYRWAPGEWSSLDTTHFYPIWSLLHAEQDRWRAMFQLQPDSENWFVDFTARSLATSVAVLKELSEEGFFGSGSSRVTVFCSVSDDSEAIWLERESARWINPAEVFAAFEPEWKEAIRQQYGSHEFLATKFAERFARLLT